ncbi:hypothetical protein OHA72_15685 [Dactylosporangium sp. NBC_01737]|uniref:hypothetical protein n=1 Tax=Dactylosporangium sp. NBC_01737 TaxID=2975959 RepID=UPI002E164ED6|nr:hypothetical protein OHA72_15685 [Dactylosporangium sp. NBC_01737]
MVDLPGISDDDSSTVDEEGTGSSINVKKVALICGALAGVALLGSAVVFGPTVLRVTQQNDTTVTTPAQVGAFTMDSSDDAKNTAEYVRDAIAAEVNLDKSVGAIYKDQAQTVILVAGTARVWKPESSLSTAFKAISDDSGAVRDVRDVDAGSLGGVMRCGVTVDKEGEIAVCGWADNGSVAVALFPGRPVADAAKAMLELRNAVEHR